MTYLASGLGLYAAMISVYWGAQYISSGLMSVVYGLFPMLTYLCAVLWLREPLWQPAKLLGVLLGVGGLVVIFQPGDAFSVVTAMGIIGVLGSAAIHAVSMVWVKRIGADVPALSVTAGGLVVAAPFYLVTWGIVDGSLPTALPDRAFMSIVYLALMGSVVGFVLFYDALKKVSAGAMALVTLVTPVLALIIGNQLNGEAIQMEVMIGAGLILFGLVVYNWGGKWATARV